MENAISMKAKTILVNVAIPLVTTWAHELDSIAALEKSDSPSTT